METSKQAPEGNAPQRVPHISALPSFSITTGKGNLDRVSVTSDPQAPYSREAAAEKEYAERISFIYDMSRELNMGVADLRPANTWMIEANIEPKARRLYGDLWYEGETCILFADTNVGKSILAVQIANAVAAGTEPFIPFIECEAGRQPVIYADLELSKRQFLNRYSSPDGMPIFLDRGLMRVELNYADWEILQTLGEKASFEEQLLDDIENMVKNTDIKVVVVDNITFLTACTEKSYDAMQLMKRLISLKQRYGVSLLILAHTPKRDIHRSITGNDLQGSKSLLNFADSAFAIGLSRRDPALRYIKQIKQRNCEQMYGADNVILTRITTEAPAEGFLRMQYEGFAHEDEHVAEIRQECSRKEMVEKCRKMQERGMSMRQIAAETGMSKSAVHYILRKNDFAAG
ncbi:AAA family ATPase [Muribaculum intestinale]|uniref:AAA family ATPase n=1 Tax=Muribaculum intestinale TaxID=1796646 RepID=UPI0025A96993|nr:AAA family ATPase [Muribaculum intestinale]